MVSNIRHQHRCDPDEVFFRLIDIICKQLETLKSNPNAEPDNENVNRSIVLLGLRLSSGVDVFRIYHADWPNLDAKIIMLLHTTFLVTYHKIIWQLEIALRIYPDSSYQNQNCQVTGFFLSKNFCSRIFYRSYLFHFQFRQNLFVQFIFI